MKSLISKMSRQDISAFRIAAVSLGCGEKQQQTDRFSVRFLSPPRQVNELDPNSQTGSFKFIFFIQKNPKHKPTPNHSV